MVGTLTLVQKGQTRGHSGRSTQYNSDVVVGMQYAVE